MSNTDEKVLAAVENALRTKPAATVDELFELAKDVSPDVAALTKRQFHARYPLQVKRKLAPPRKKRAPGKKAPAPKQRTSGTSARDSVRGSFLKFAQDLAAAEERKDVVKVVAGVDRYVDEVLKATGRA
ncbi:MAG TPA: hypothetical protein VLA36_02955 [Longimicrobiales bacterium]|nr:hypothetical protein [Longimicrobiales bacterium]